MNSPLADLRKDYTLQGLNESEADLNPFQQFQIWFDQALAAQLPEVNAMTLATATPNGIPSARIVLLKGLDERGFVFYTNYESRKGQELAQNPQASLVFLWAELERQVRVQGQVEKVSAPESDAYFQSRPLGSRLGAWASLQSQVVASREVLEERLESLGQQYPDQQVPRPSHWGGYRVLPTEIEFWQGRPSRLHDRLRYRRQADGSWLRDRLCP
ncbi:MAG: pyridoxamine 5'-phosphate oxidase [Leptolyngbyaceae bacterium]|nr:pyridoxamine 5'-phosphate oxidase [Leptolyngbyaceae bacterium]